MLTSLDARSLIQ